MPWYASLTAATPHQVMTSYLAMSDRSLSMLPHIAWAWCYRMGMDVMKAPCVGAV